MPQVMHRLSFDGFVKSPIPAEYFFTFKRKIIYNGWQAKPERLAWSLP